MKNLDVLDTPISLAVKAVLLPSRWSGSVQRRSLERTGTTNVDIKNNEFLFLRGRFSNLELSR